MVTPINKQSGTPVTPAVSGPTKSTAPAAKTPAAESAQVGWVGKKKEVQGVSPAQDAAGMKTVQALFRAIGQGEPSAVMKDLKPLLNANTEWKVPSGSALTEGQPGDASKTHVDFKGESGIKTYVERLYNLSGQGAEGVKDAKFHPMFRSSEKPTVLKDGSLEYRVHAEATAVRGSVALDGKPELNVVKGQNGYPDTGKDGRIHGQGLYELKVNVSADGKKLLKLETIPHDPPLFNRFWGQTPITLPQRP